LHTEANPVGHTAPVPLLRIALLAAAVVGVLVHPRRVPVWLAPAAMLAVAFAAGAVDVSSARDALDPLAEPLVFLLLAVPLAVLLDQLGFFAAIAARIDRTRHLQLGLWLFAAGVTTVFNLDAAVVLLTPLYVRIARRHGLDPLAASFPPILLAALGSSALPVSNLTNLLAAARYDLAAHDFLLRLGPASAVATGVGYVAYRHAFPAAPPTAGDLPVVEPRALRYGAPVVLFVLIGFTAGDALGVPAWAVAAVADCVLVALTRSIPWRTVPLRAAALAATLGVLADAAAPHLGLDRALAGTGTLGELRVMGLAVIGANAMNNLPAVLVAMPALGRAPGGRLWALLLGVNMGPALLVTGSLAGLLWVDTVRKLGVRVDARTFSRVGARVAGPAIVAAAITLLACNRLAG
jgi:arsenical pump membrane protein